jgi:hypothetical protein
MSAQTPTPGRPVPAAPAGVTERAATPATVTVVHRRASDVVCGDVIALPDEVFFPIPARDGAHRTFAWQSRPFRSLRNPHRWRLVCEVDHLDDDEPDDAAHGITASLPFGFRVLRVSDDDPDQGQQYQSQIIAVREHDLIDVQQRTPPDPAPDSQDRAGRAAEASPDRPHTTDARFRDYPVRDGVVRVFDGSPHSDPDSDDASDMYVLEVFGISVLLRLRTTRTHPADRPQVFLHVDNEGREPSGLAVEVANGGETHYRI